ncbi:hypothetical protein Agub_g6795 [Astrephomene gubernaculifera]|uniref:Transcription factor IIIC 90kDa subunit N-terminal domain-containing protein n=1 Tax=Astrephomene gubernaculifera TaxID=47775 RepID=A0AAD3DP14_9CHLO|nr:hypothetical protein Agub_g6795 [Astrephomene gubernaculifera]
MQVQDHVGIYQVPEALDCIKWSQDNLLAVAAGQSITIFNPAVLGGPRAFAPLRSVDLSAVAPGFRPKDWLDSAQFAMSAVHEVNLKNPVSDQSWRAIAWSPMGCTSSGGCLLAALSPDFKVRLLGPPSGSLSSTWREVVDVTELLRAHMAATGWQEIDSLAGCGRTAAQSSALLRLRGGCPSPLKDHMRLGPQEQLLRRLLQAKAQGPGLLPELLRQHRISLRRASKQRQLPLPPPRQAPSPG